MEKNAYLPINRELLEFYGFYVGVLVLKYVIAIGQVGLSRVMNKCPINPEDGAVLGAKVYLNENVERNRRAHLNDLENIPIFIAISFLYLLTNPSVNPTQWLIRIYVFSRILYTILYTIIKSVIRIPVYQTGVLIIVYLSLNVIGHFAF